MVPAEHSWRTILAFPGKGWIAFQKFSELWCIYVINRLHRIFWIDNRQWDDIAAFSIKEVIAVMLIVFPVFFKVVIACTQQDWLATSTFMRVNPFLHLFYHDVQFKSCPNSNVKYLWCLFDSRLIWKNPYSLSEVNLFFIVNPFSAFFMLIGLYDMRAKECEIHLAFKIGSTEINNRMTKDNRPSGLVIQIPFNIPQIIFCLHLLCRFRRHLKEFVKSINQRLSAESDRTSQLTNNHIVDEPAPCKLWFIVWNFNILRFASNRIFRHSLNHISIISEIHNSWNNDTGNIRHTFLINPWNFIY